MFQLEDFQHCVLVRGGVHYQAPLARRSHSAVTPDRVFAKLGSGYVLLSEGGFTSNQKVRWEPSEADGVHWPERGSQKPLWRR